MVMVMVTVGLTLLVMFREGDDDVMFVSGGDC